MNNLPEPFYFSVQDVSSYSRGSYSKYATPYSSIDWQKAATKYAVEIPEIVDMTQGKSVCKQCKAKYVGYQPHCSAKTTFHMPSGEYWGHKVHGYNYLRKNFEEECKGALEWDLQEKFDYQSGLFSLLESIQFLPELQNDPFVKFDKHFPQGVTDHLRIRRLCQTVQNLEIQNLQIQDALRQIANKMNSAGACLSFGF